MKERLSTSEKEKLKTKLENEWKTSTYNLLEKLSSEISNTFWVKQNPWIYKESIKKLISLQENINNENDSKRLDEELKNISAHLSEEKKKEFILAIKWAKEVLKNSKELIYAIKKSCQIKLSFVNKDVNEKNLRMILNFGHTFAHAIEVKNNYSKKVTHGEAVLAGMILATKLSLLRKMCKRETLNQLLKIYNKNNLNYTFKKYMKVKEIISLIPYLKNDKKNDDEKINFILLDKIGKTTMPNKCKISISELRKSAKLLTQY